MIENVCLCMLMAIIATVLMDADISLGIKIFLDTFQSLDALTFEKKLVSLTPVEFLINWIIL